jgi:hypothetical protein
MVAQAGQAVNADGLMLTAGPLRSGNSMADDTLCAPVAYSNGRKEPVSFNGGFDWKLQDPNGAIVMTGLLGSDHWISAANTVSTFDRVQVAARISRAATRRFAAVVSRSPLPIFVLEITRQAVAA